MAKFTVTLLPLCGDSVTVNVMFVEPLLPSTTVALPTVSVGSGSSFWMMPAPCAFLIVPLTALSRLTLNVSSSSFLVSPATAMVTGSDTTPGANVSVPAAAVYSAGAVAVESAAAKDAETGMSLAPARLTVNVNGVSPLLPSASMTSLM